MDFGRWLPEHAKEVERTLVNRGVIPVRPEAADERLSRGAEKSGSWK